MQRVLKSPLLRKLPTNRRATPRGAPLHHPIASFLYSTDRCLDVGQPTFFSHPQLLKEGEITSGITESEYTSRRKRLLELLPDKSLAIIASAPVKMMTDVVPYPFRQDADYLYLTGCLQPGGIAVLSKDCGFCMFMPDPDPHDVVWQGEVAGVETALDIFKADRAFPMHKMHEILQDMIGRASKLFHNVKTALPAYTKLEAFRMGTYNDNVKDLSRYTHELRWIKSPSEVKLMRQSAAIACQSLLQTMSFSKTFPEESKLSAKVEYECKMRGAQRMAFNPVVGGGTNGAVIHYSRNDQNIAEGDLVLMDVGCEFHGYLSDLTRTWPPCGTFSSAQEALYDLILEANKECVKLCRPGVSIQQIHNSSACFIAGVYYWIHSPYTDFPFWGEKWITPQFYKSRKVQMLCEGLKELGILKDTRSAHSYHQLNPTSIGHYLGMDVHDCSTISNNRPLQPGVVITIEPGLYIPHTADVPKRYRGIGIRIEDDVLITDTGYEVLTGSMPKEISHLKSLLNFGNNT